jgi:glycosyltransferase involved in cell wall biosynthesis
MLVPHEPTLDPRVHYTAESLAKEYEVTVVSVVLESDHRPEGNYATVPSYATARIPFEGKGALWMAAEYVRLRFGPGSHRNVYGVMAGALSRVFLGVLLALFGLGAILLQLLELPIVLALGLRAMAATFLAPTWRSSALIASPISLRIARAALRKLAWNPIPRERFAVWARGLKTTLQVFLFTFRTNGLLLDYLRRQGIAADVLYVHDLYALQAAVILKRRTGCRVVYDSHEFFPHLYEEWPFPQLTRAYEASLVQSVDRYITVSPQLARELRQLYAVAEIDVIPNVEPRPARPPTPLNTGVDALAAGRLKVLYQGSFAPGRGLEEVIEAWRQVDGRLAALFLRGPPSPVRDDIERRARGYGLLGQSVFILEPVLERDLISGAAEGDAGLIPYKTESPAYRVACPNKLSQYIHAGAAVIANRIPFVEDLVNENQIGLCYDVDNPRSFVYAVHLLAGNRVVIDRYKHASRHLSQHGYSWERYEGRLLSLVRSVAGAANETSRSTA